ncbi:MAG: FmdB family zinc ribbon protein, partial [Dehalococcoidia bacterium]
MPIYPFQCQACGAEFVVTRKASAAAEPAPCPACGGATRRIFTAVGRSGASAKGGEG